MFKLKSTLKKEEGKKLFNNYDYGEKPKLKDLIAIMIAEYLLIIPIVIGGTIIFGLILWFMGEFWLS